MNVFFHSINLRMFNPIVGRWVKGMNVTMVKEIDGMMERVIAG